MVSIELTRLESVLQRDRAVILAGLASVTLVAWMYLFYHASTMTFTGGMDMAAHMAMPQLQSWGAIELLLRAANPRHHIHLPALQLLRGPAPALHRDPGRRTATVSRAATA